MPISSYGLTHDDSRAHDFEVRQWGHEDGDTVVVGAVGVGGLGPLVRREGP